MYIRLEMNVDQFNLKKIKVSDLKLILYRNWELIELESYYLHLD